MKPDGSVDTAALTLAASHFMDKSQDEIDECIQRTLEGHQRQIIGTLTVEEIYKVSKRRGKPRRPPPCAETSADVPKGGHETLALELHVM